MLYPLQNLRIQYHLLTHQHVSSYLVHIVFYCTVISKQVIYYIFPKQLFSYQTTNNIICYKSHVKGKTSLILSSSLVFWGLFFYRDNNWLTDKQILTRWCLYTFVSQLFLFSKCHSTGCPEVNVQDSRVVFLRRK